MRGRSIRLSILILAILGISLVSLGFREINFNIPGVAEIRKGGTGPLGLKLGLDLRGGAHLVYQADVGTRIKATLPEFVNEPDAIEALNGIGIDDFDLRIEGGNTLDIKTTRVLDESQRGELREALENTFGAIDDSNDFQVTDTLPPTVDDMVGVLEIINRRVNLLGTDEPIVQQFGDDRIIVQLPGASGSVTDVKFVEPADLEDVERILSDAGFADYVVDQRDPQTFRIRTTSIGLTAQQDLSDDLVNVIGDFESFNVTGGVEAAKALIGGTARLEFKRRDCPDPTCFIFNDSDLGLTGDDLENAFASTSSATGEWAVNIQFNSRGAEIFSVLTQEIVGDPTKRIAVFLDDEELTAPTAEAWIRNGRSQITGNFNRETARTLAIQLESGRLPVPLKLIQESEVDALLGSESLEKSLIAGLIGLGLVMVFMVAYYRLAGVVAAVSLIFYSVVVLATFKLIPLTLTLPHLGGFILSIGLAVDANILIFERMKEEIRVGRTLASSMEVGFSRGLASHPRRQRVNHHYLPGAAVVRQPARWGTD